MKNMTKLAIAFTACLTLGLSMAGTVSAQPVTQQDAAPSAAPSTGKSAKDAPNLAYGPGRGYGRGPGWCGPGYGGPGYGMPDYGMPGYGGPGYGPSRGFDSPRGKLDNRRLPPRPDFSGETTTVSGALSWQKGGIAIVDSGKTYYITGIQRLLGFVDGLKEGATVKVEGYTRDAPNAKDTYILLASKVTFNGKDYNLRPNAN